MTVVSLDEHRAQRQQEQADLDYQPVPTEHALRWATRLLARLEGHNHIEPDHGPGTCTSCGNQAPVRFTYGTFELCRTCRRARLRAAAKADMPLPAGPPQPDPIDDLLNRARRWIPNAAHTMPLAHIQRALLNQGIPRAHVYELVDQAADLARAEPATTIATNGDAQRNPAAP
jgi:hypothetical protein